MDTTQNPTPTNTTPTSVPPTVIGEHKKIGPIVAILVIVLVLVIAAIYLFATRVTPETTNTSGAAMYQESNTTASVTPVSNSSDDVDDIETDLNASTNGLDGQNF